MTRPPKALIIPTTTAQAVVDYLKTRPFEEVHSLIGQLLSLKSVEDSEDDEDQDGGLIRNDAE